MNTAKEIVNISSAVSTLLEEIGEDIEREGLQDTPARVAKMWMEITSGLRDPEPKVTTFSAKGQQQLITVLDIDYWSLCEHHLVPFYGKVHIGYIPNDKLAGLSKFARITDWYSKRPQIQENMTTQIADFIQKKLDPKGLIVVVEGTHLCMSMRGVKKPNHVTITNAIRGDVPKEEFLSILSLDRGRK